MIGETEATIQEPKTVEASAETPALAETSESVEGSPSQGVEEEVMPEEAAETKSENDAQPEDDSDKTLEPAFESEEDNEKTEDSPAEPSSPQPEPEVLPVLSTGLPYRVASLQFNQAPQLRRSTSVPSFMGQVSTEPQLTDRSAPELQTTELPSFATPTPVIGSKLPSIPELHINTSAPNIRPLARGDSFLNMPLSENSRSKQFTQRLDYMVGEFFTRQVAKLATSTPEGVDRIHKIFTQRIREKLGQQWAHVTAQPEVDEASKEVEVMYEYFSQLEKMVEKQRNALQMLNEAEAELSLFYQQMGYQEHGEELGDHLVHLGMGYHQECKQRVPLIGALDSYLAFVKTFRAKAINDSRDTIKSQKTARVEFDSYASKLGHLEEKAIKASQKAGAAARSKGEDTAKYQEKELDQTRCRFQAAKTRYQVLSTQVIDKAGLLEMKRGVDYLAHIEHLRKAYDAYIGGHSEKLGSPKPVTPSDQTINGSTSAE